MRLLIASDIHGSLYYFEKLLKRYSAESASRLVLLGDLLYHGPRNALPRDYSPGDLIPILNSVKNEVIAVRGNCDSEVDRMCIEFPLDADYSVIFDGEATIFISHGHIYNADNPLPHKEGDVLICGHTHVPCVIRTDFLFLNPGSVSIPKSGSDNSYLIYENGVFTFKNIDGTVYNEVPIK